MRARAATAQGHSSRSNSHGVVAVVAVGPIDVDVLRLGDGDMQRISGKWALRFSMDALYVAHAGDAAHGAATTCSSCFLSRTSMVISTIAESSCFARQRAPPRCGC